MRECCGNKFYESLAEQASLRLRKNKRPSTDFNLSKFDICMINIWKFIESRAFLAGTKCGRLRAQIQSRVATDA